MLQLLRLPNYTAAAITLRLLCSSGCNRGGVRGQLIPRMDYSELDHYSWHICSLSMIQHQGRSRPPNELQCLSPHILLSKIPSCPVRKLKPLSEDDGNDTPDEQLRGWCQKMMGMTPRMSSFEAVHRAISTARTSQGFSYTLKAPYEKAMQRYMQRPHSHNRLMLLLLRSCRCISSLLDREIKRFKPEGGCPPVIP